MSNLGAVFGQPSDSPKERDMKRELTTFLDVLLIEEIPERDSQSTGMSGIDGQEIVRTQRAARVPQTGRILSLDTKFPMAGVWVDMPYSIGDVVQTNEFGRDYIYLDPDDEFRKDATRYYLIHYADVQGLVAPRSAGHEEDVKNAAYLPN
jgi:hypothetical protein